MLTKWEDMWYTLLQKFGLYKDVATKARLKKFCYALHNPIRDGMGTSFAKTACDEIAEMRLEMRLELRLAKEDTFYFSDKVMQLNVRSMELAIRPFVQWMRVDISSYGKIVIEYDCRVEDVPQVEYIISKYTTCGKFNNVGVI